MSRLNDSQTPHLQYIGCEVGARKHRTEAMPHAMLSANSAVQVAYKFLSAQLGGGARVCVAAVVSDEVRRIVVTQHSEGECAKC